MMYLPRLCGTPSEPGMWRPARAVRFTKREEDGIVLIDQDKCRGWRMCITGCP